MLPPRSGKVSDDADAFRIGNTRKNYRDRICCRPHCIEHGCSVDDNDIRCRGHQRGYDGAHLERIGPPIVGVDVSPFGPSQFRPSRLECFDPTLGFRVVRRSTHDNADGGIMSFLLRVRCKRPRCRTANNRDELAALHSITSSARASSDGGTVRPRPFAVLRLITNSYLVGAWTGRSAGFSPLRMRST